METLTKPYGTLEFTDSKGQQARLDFYFATWADVGADNVEEFGQRLASVGFLGKVPADALKHLKQLLPLGQHKNLYVVVRPPEPNGPLFVDHLEMRDEPFSHGEFPLGKDARLASDNCFVFIKSDTPREQ